MEKNPENKAALIYLKRCASYMVQAVPPPDWTGVEDFVSEYSVQLATIRPSANFPIWFVYQKALFGLGILQKDPKLSGAIIL